MNDDIPTAVSLDPRPIIVSSTTPKPDRESSSISSTGETSKPDLESLSATGYTMKPQKVPVSVAVDPVALVTTECITVTAAMRKHARWAHSSVSTILGGSSAPSPSLQGSRPSTPRDDLRARRKSKNGAGFVDGIDEEELGSRWGLRGKKGKSMQDNPLIAGFARLRRELKGCKGEVKAMSM